MICFRTRLQPNVMAQMEALQKTALSNFGMNYKHGRCALMGGHQRDRQLGVVDDAVYRWAAS